MPMFQTAAGRYWLKRRKANRDMSIRTAVTVSLLSLIDKVTAKPAATLRRWVATFDVAILAGLVALAYWVTGEM